MGSAAGFLIIDDTTEEWYRQSDVDLLETICHILLPRLIRAKTLSAIHVILEAGRGDPSIRDFKQTMDQVSLWQLEHRDGIRGALEIARSTQCETLVIIRPENPLTAPEEVDRLVGHHRVHRCAYSSNHEPQGQNGYPRGLGAEAISLAHLEFLKREEPDLRCWSDVSTGMKRQRKGALLRSLPSRTGPEVDLSLSGESKGLNLLIEELGKVSKDPSWSPEEILKAYRNVNRVKTVVLLEQGEGILDAVEWGKTGGGKVHFIALDPCGSYELERRGIPFTTKADYMTAGEFNRIGMDNFTFLNNLCDAIDGDLEDRFPGMPVRPAISVFYELKIIFDVVFVVAATLERILAAEKPDAIRIYARPPPRGNPDERSFHADDSICTFLVSLACTIPVSLIEAGETRASPPPYRDLWFRVQDSLRSLTGSSSLLFNMGILGKRKGILSVHLPVTSWFRYPRGETVLVYGSGYNWDDSLEDLYRTGIRRILRISDPKVRESLNNRDEIREIIYQTGEKYRVNRGFPISMDRRVIHYLLRKTASLVLRSLEECLVAHHQATTVIRSKGVRALLLSTLPTPAGNAFVQAARDSGIPVISWQHGGAGYAYHPMMAHVEMAGSTLHLVFGEGTRRSYLKTCEQYRRFTCPDISAVGSSSLDGLRLKRDQNRGRRKVVYVTTLYLENLFQVSMLIKRGEFDGELWSFQRSVIDLAARHPECEFVIKLHPAHRSRQPLLAYITDRGITSTRIVVDEQSIMDLVQDADAVLFDLITTGILQVLTTEKEIFVYSGLITIDSDVEELLARRAHVSRDPMECIASLERYLSVNDIKDGADCRNTEFLREFGTHKNDGLSGQRAAELVVTMLRQHEQS